MVTFELTDKLILINFRGELIGDSPEKMFEEVRDYFAANLVKLRMLHICALNFAFVNKVDTEFLRILPKLSKFIKGCGKDFFAHNAKPEIMQYIKENGLDNHMPSYRVESSASGPKVDVNFINPFIEGTVNTLHVQCQVKITPGKPFLKATFRIVSISSAIKIFVLAGNISILLMRTINQETLASDSFNTNLHMK